jgi:hypothetical protein
MQIDRRRLMGAAAVAATAFASPLAAKVRPFANSFGPRSRVIYVNDIAGDPDGRFATVHMALSTTSQLRGIVGTAATFLPDEGPEAAAALAREMLGLMGLKVPVHVGSAGKFGKDHTPRMSAGVQAIIDEAMRTDTSLPLFIAVGGGLTEVASAIKLEPRVAERARLVWIGGGSWPEGATREYNFMLDPDAAQFVFNETRIPIWTIPQAVYATCVISMSELQAYVAPHGKIGRWLYEKQVAYPGEFSKRIPKEFNIKLNTGETWTLGDSPLAVLTSLGDWVPDFDGKTVNFDKTGAGHYDEVICPTLNADGTFTPRAEGRKIRIYKDIDTRLMFGDFFAKLALNYS